MLEYRSGGRRVSPDKFFENLHRQGLEIAFQEIEERTYGAVASIVDPETNKHSSVFVRRVGDEGFTISTTGSLAFARELEKRLGVEQGAIKSMAIKPQPQVPIVYLAHASEDHVTLARPLAERLMADGIEVWLDDWEIQAGDSLRRKMELGLGSCTHFLVLLTPRSLGKPWVETEIDVGFVRAVQGQSKFIGLRVGVAIDQLSPFLGTLRCPSVESSNDSEVSKLIGEIHGVSNKPPLGSAPRYVKTLPEGLNSWTPAAAAVAEFLVRNSVHGTKFDPQVTIDDVVKETGLHEEDVRLGVLDLRESGLIECSEASGSDEFWPQIGLFIEFDRYFFDFNNEQDAIAIANRLVSEKIESMAIEDLAKKFSDWPIRRLNSALNFLEEAKHVSAMHTLSGGPWTMTQLRVTDRTKRFVRDHI